MLARVPIISAYDPSRESMLAYDPSRESMLAYASPSNKIAIMITGLVIDCLGTNNFLCDKKLSTKTNLVVSLSKQPLVYIYVLFIILQTYPIRPTKSFQFHTCSR